MPIQPGANRGAAEGELSQRVDRLLGTPFPGTNLLRVTAEFLAEPDRRCVHQMGPTDLDHVVEFVRFRGQRVAEFLQGRDETILELLRGADVNGRRDHVVARLPHVDVIVRVNQFARADRFAGQLAQRLAMTSFAFVFVLVPEPVWKMSSGKCSSSLPSTTSSAACTMSALRSASSRPRS